MIRRVSLGVLCDSVLGIILGMSNDKPVNRRAFFREGLRGLLGPLSKVVGPVERAAEQLSRLELHPHRHPNPTPPPAPAAPPPRSVPLQLWLRPPGALQEDRFVETCSRCGNCERVCPAHAIRIDHTGEQGAGAPYIDADTMSCVVCDGLLCMQNCPSGALVSVPKMEIDMGTAVWHYEDCLRSRNGEDCTICIDQCPLGADAIELRGNDIHVLEDGCIGCGVCQHYCPTTPKSIKVVPR